MGNDVDILDCAIHDGNLLTFWNISRQDGLRIQTNGLFFDQVIIHSKDENILGLLIEISSELDSSPFWTHQIKNQNQLQIFDLGKVALSNFPVYILDIFSYNGEIAALFHVQYLYPVVNEFIIMECWWTNSGVRKPFLFFQQPNITAQFAPYMDKITYLTIDEVPPTPADFIWPHGNNDAFWRENYQRIVGQKYLSERAADPSSKISLDMTVVLYVDSDEIFDRKILASLRDLSFFPSSYSTPSSQLFARHQKIRFHLTLFYYNFNWSGATLWDLAFATDLRSYLLIKDLLAARVDFSPNDFFISNSGWHLSYFTSIHDIVRKIGSMAHREYDLEELKSIEEIKARVREGKDIFRREDFELIPFDFAANELNLPEGWEDLQSTLRRIQELD